MNQGMIPDWAADDYADMTLCDMYHCTPSQLDGEDRHRMMRHLAIKGAIRKYQEYESQ
jgi:hypothetical protein